MSSTNLQRFSGKWETKQVSEFGDVVTGETPNIRNQAFWDGSYPWITPTDITPDRDMTLSERMLTQEGLNSIRRTLPPNTVLVTCIASIGKNTILRKTGTCNQQINAVIPNSDHNAEFLYYLFEYNSNYLLANAGVTATPIISKSIFSEFVFQVPPLNEQRAIAEALSDVDGLLNALEALIAKKQAIKQATMQQLLTGKTRLPGFSGAWREMRIGDLFDAKAGGDLIQSRYSYVQDNRYPYPIYANGLEQQGLYGFSDYAEEPAGAITVTARGTLGQAFYRDSPFVAIGRLLILKPKVSLDARFFCEYINYGIHFAIESTGVPQLTAPQVSRYLLPAPSESEQRAIASVLSDMDAEIAALEQRRDKTRAIKQGMMQQLLTGRVRLVKSE